MTATTSAVDPARPGSAPANGSRRDRRSFFAAMGLILLSVIATVGYPVPYENELVYLLRLRVVQDSSFLRGDWTYAGEFHEHLVFNQIFAPFTSVISIELLGWVGRLGCWIALTALLLAIAGRLGIRPLPAGVALAIWVPCQLRLVGSDWMFGTFEAKPIAYIFLLGGLLFALRGSVVPAMACCGLCFTLHPGVGPWGAAPLVAALVLYAPTRRTALRWCWLAAVLALPGAVAVSVDLEGSSASRSFYTFVVDQVFPFHLDPLYFGPANFVLLVAMFAFSVTYHLRWAPPSPALRFVGLYNCLIAVPFALGVIVYFAGYDDLLKYFPSRVFPVLTTIFFFLDLALVFQDRRRLWSSRATPTSRQVLGATAVLVLATAVIWNPVKLAAFSVRENAKAWTEADDDLDRALEWVAENTPEDAIVVMPPGRSDTFYLSERAQIANVKAVAWEEIVEWRERIAAQLGEDYLDEVDVLDDEDEMEDAFDRLTEAGVLGLQEEYGAEFLVGRTDYDFEIVHQVGDYKVYELP